VKDLQVSKLLAEKCNPVGLGFKIKETKTKNQIFLLKIIKTKRAAT
jgi:hypothetical protein